MQISSNFDSGNIELVNIDDPKNIQLKIRNDSNAKTFQWFHFRVQDAEGYPCKFNILNAGESSFPEGWEGYQACASYDRIAWFRVPTNYDGKILTIDHMPEKNSVFYAYFAPYSYDQHLDLIHAVQQSPYCFLESVGETIEKRNIDLLIVGVPGEGKKKIWILARQHPGESMSSWFIQGLLGRLLDEDDPVARKLLEKVVFYIIPNMNIDGSIKGNLRVNAAGKNLNREWGNPSEKESPEVFNVKNKMDEIGVDLNLDIHGDEELPYNFVSRIDGIPGFNDRLKSLQHKFMHNWEKTNPDFQTEHGYQIDDPGTANLNLCAKQISHRFNCLSLTVEMPFKDNKNLPDPIYGWSPERSEKMGESILDAILSIVDELR